MKSLISLVILALFAAAPALAVEPSSAFEAANARFAQGDYEGAASAYRALAETHPHADVLFNLGTAEAEAGHTGRAVWAFEEALRLRPGDDDARHNLEVVRQRALREGLSAGGDLRVILPGEDDVGTGLLTALTPGAVTWGFGLTWVALFGLLIALRLSPRRGAEDTRQTVLTLGAVVAGLGALAFGGLLAGRLLVVSEATYGVVVADRSLVQAGPGQQYRPVARVMAGVKLRLRGEEEDWLNVVLPDGGSGWVKGKDIARLGG